MDEDGREIRWQDYYYSELKEEFGSLLEGSGFDHEKRNKTLLLTLFEYAELNDRMRQYNKRLEEESKK